jgi:hypothetical protein
MDNAIEQLQNWASVSTKPRPCPAKAKSATGTSQGINVPRANSHIAKLAERGEGTSGYTGWRPLHPIPPEELIGDYAPYAIFFGYAQHSLCSLEAQAETGIWNGAATQSC